MKHRFIQISVLFIVWYITSLYINKEVILPLPTSVLYSLIQYLKSSNFYMHILASLIRITISLIIASSGIFLGILCALNHKIESYISFYLSILSTIPQIAFIILFMVWFQSSTALIIIVLLMIYPIFYYNSLEAVHNIDSDLYDVVKLYHHPWYINLFKVYIPLIMSSIKASVQNAIPMALKVGVMAEVFVSSRYGIGHLLYMARANIDMASIFALVIIMILMMNLIKKLISSF